MFNRCIYKSINDIFNSIMKNEINKYNKLLNKYDIKLSNAEDELTH
jgi:hypothetical protein